MGQWKEESPQLELEQSNLSKQITVFQQLIMEALQYLGTDASSAIKEQKHLSKSFDINDQVRLSSCIRFQPRPSSFKQLLYICDGDHNGVIHYVGTSYGEHPCMNPVLAKKIFVTASIPLSRYIDAKVLVSRRYQICVWCWHHIMDMAEKDRRCPACREPYNKEKIVGMSVSCDSSVCPFLLQCLQIFVRSIPSLLKLEFRFGGGRFPSGHPGC